VLRLLPRREPRLTAFVLSGGAGLGALKAGTLHALYEREIWPDMLVGTSVGAVNAGFLASRPRSTETTRELADAWRSLRRAEVFPFSVRTLTRGLRRKHDHLVPDRGIREVVRRHIELGSLEEATIPLRVVCFDAAEGCDVALSSGPAHDAIVASCSIPGILPPVWIDGRRLVDGGVFGSTPISHAVAAGAGRVYVLATCDRQHRPPPSGAGALDAVLNSFRILVANRLATDLDRYAKRAELIVLPAVNPMGIAQQLRASRPADSQRVPGRHRGLDSQEAGQVRHRELALGHEAPRSAVLSHAVEGVVSLG
jgi:NTE family protein